MPSIPIPHVRRTALVTGAAGGIGAAIARRLAERGDRVVLLDLAAPEGTARSLEELGAEVIAVAADVADPASVDAAAQAARAEFGPVEIVVNNAAIGTLGGIGEVDVTDWRQTIDVNLTGPFVVTKAVVPHMRGRNWGRVVNVASTSIYTNTPGMVAYIASKGGVLGLTSALATDLGRFGITVNAVAPGFTRTPMVDGAIGAGAMPPDILDVMRARQALDKPTDAGDVAGAVAFLTGEDAAMITGQFLAADAGLTRHF